jgi:hypothetical protein
VEQQRTVLRLELAQHGRCFRSDVDPVYVHPA